MEYSTRLRLRKNAVCKYIGSHVNVTFNLAFSGDAVGDFINGYLVYAVIGKRQLQRSRICSTRNQCKRNGYICLNGS